MLPLYNFAIPCHGRPAWKTSQCARATAGRRVWLVESILLRQSRATFSERGPDETFQSSSRAGVTNENPKWGCIILQYLYCKSGKSVRWLVLLAMEKDINVRLDGWAWQEQNVIQMAVREEGAMARLRVLHFGEELFATVGAAKQWNMATTRWTRAMNVGKFLEGRVMSRKKDSGEEL